MRGGAGVVKGARRGGEEDTWVTIWFLFFLDESVWERALGIKLMICFPLMSHFCCRVFL